MSVLKYKGQDLMGIDRDWYDNLIPWPYYRSSPYTHNGITYTVQNDGSVVVNGTATDNSMFEFTVADTNLSKVENSFLSGGVSGGSTSTYCLALQLNNSSGSRIEVFRDTGNGVQINKNEYSNVSSFTVWINIYPNATVNNLVFKPMLERGELKHPFKPPMDSSSNKVNKSDLVDYIVEQGTTGFWYWRKWKSGIAECWGLAELSLSYIDDTFDEGRLKYRYQSSIDVPAGLFTTIKYANCAAGVGNGYGNVVYCRAANNTTISFAILANIYGTQTVHLHVEAKGLWKAFNS